MKHYLLPNKGNFYKANLHCHTNCSDGKFTPEEIKKLYSEKGYSIVAFTDHEVMIPQNHLTDENFLAITGVEFAVNMGSYDYLPSTHLNFLSKDKNRRTFPAFRANKLWKAIEHMNQYIDDEMREYTDELVPGYNDEFFNAVIKKCNEEGLLVAFNHPVGSLQNFNDYGNLKGLWGMECHNGGPEIGSFPESMHPIVEMHRVGERILPIAADDTHGDNNLFGGFNMIKAEKLDYDVIMTALEKGEFYASEGPEINELYIEDGIVHVKTSDAHAIILHSMQRFSRKVIAKDGETVNEASFDINGFIESCKNFENILPYGDFIRIEVIDKNFKHAYSRCYYLEEFEG